LSGNAIAKCVSMFSQMYHYLAYSVKEPKQKLQRGILTISIDVDVGSKKLGTLNEGKNDINVSDVFSEYLIGKVEEKATPLFVDLFDDVEVPVTFAIRGQLTEVDNSVLELVLNSSVKHDIGAHGYYHKAFGNLSYTQAENELRLISEGMKKFGVRPKSFVFPRNSVAHLNLLEKYEYKCYRGYGDFRTDCMCIDKKGQLYNIHPSLYLFPSISPRFVKKILDISIAKRLPFHMWFHPWSFGLTPKSIRSSINRVFLPLLKHAKEKERDGVLNLKPMLSAIEEFE
jgi:peptidoglycan/xylan/chitin deacetylase (PgdA/CDA1 family)